MYGQNDRQTDRPTDRTNFTFMWDSLRLAPINQSVLAFQAPKSYRRLLNYVLQLLVNKNVNMVKQLYYSEIHSKTSKSICLSYILASILKLTMY